MKYSWRVSKQLEVLLPRVSYLSNRVKDTTYPNVERTLQKIMNMENVCKKHK